MTKLEAMEIYHDDILAALKECTEKSIRSHGKIEYSIYCWEDDGVQTVEDVYGGSLLMDNDDETQDLFFITKVSAGSYLDFDMTEEDEEEVRELDEDALIEEIMDNIDWDERMGEIEEEAYYEEESA